MFDYRSGRIAIRFAGVALSVLLLATIPVGGAVAQESPPPDTDLPVLSLADCVKLALEGSPTMLVAEERKNIAGQDITDAWSSFLPSVNLSRTWQKSERTDFDIEQTTPAGVPLLVDGGGVFVFPIQAPNGTFSDETIHTKYKDWAGQVNLNVFSGFSKFSSLSSAKNSMKAAELTRDYTRELVAEDVISAYYNLLRYQRLLQVAIETRDQTARELERTETYFRLGSAAKSDVLQQRVALENRKLEVVVADNTVKKAFADLAYSMNRPMASGFQVDASTLLTDYVVEDVTVLYGEALTNRLDLLSSERTVEARRKDVTTATSTAYPSIDIFADYRYYDNESPYRFGAQTSDATSFGYRVNWNIFDRMRTWTGRSRAKANARIAEYELDQARLNVQVEIRQLHNSLIEAREKAHVSAETIKQSQEDLRLAQERFRVGAGTNLDVIVAQVNLASARGQEVQAMCDFLIAKAMMDRAVGRHNIWAGSSPE